MAVERKQATKEFKWERAMEKVNRILISRSDAKKVANLEKALSLLGLSIDDIVNAIKENAELKERVDLLEKEMASYKKECREEIRKELQQISTNVHNEVVKSTKNVEEGMKNYLFKGNRINEQF